MTPTSDDSSDSEDYGLGADADETDFPWFDDSQGPVSISPSDFMPGINQIHEDRLRRYMRVCQVTEQPNVIIWR